MPGVRLILALHDHQPVGNFDGVFEGAYRDSYLPFLDVMEDYPDLPFVLHTSGPLLEWLVERRPEYVARVRAMAQSGRVEILGGGFFEPILTMIPHRDRVGQIREFASYLEEHFGTRPRGAWLAERVWEQHLASSLVESGVEYTVLDDFNFLRSGVPEGDLRGYFLTEDDGRLLKVFPISERLRYLIPFQEPHATYEYLKAIAAERSDSVLVFADDGEKFGSVARDPSARLYGTAGSAGSVTCSTPTANGSRPTTFAQAGRHDPADGQGLPPRLVLSREMTEWVLPPSNRLVAYHEASPQDPGSTRPPQGSEPFVRAGGVWRNFKAKLRRDRRDVLPDARDLEPPGRACKFGRRPTSTPSKSPGLNSIMSQCNCPYWHGAFGGLYLPHLRNAIYRSLDQQLTNAMDVAEGSTGPRVSLDVGDFNLDARQEVRLENDRLIAFVRPATGGHIYELDVRHASTNLLATLDRRPEAYHAAIAAATGTGSDDYDGPPSILNKVVLKQEGLGQLLVYDRHPRKALVDHFLADNVSLDDFQTNRHQELGDFVTGTYLSRVHRGVESVSLIMERPGMADGHAIQVESLSFWKRRARRWTFITCSKDFRPASRSTSRSRSTSPRWPGTPLTAIIPTPMGGGSACSMPGSISKWSKAFT